MKFLHSFASMNT